MPSSFAYCVCNYPLWRVCCIYFRKKWKKRCPDMLFFLFLFLFFFWETGYAHLNLTLREKKYFNIYIPWNAHFLEKLSIPTLNIRTMATMSNAKMTKICNSMDFWTSKNNKNEKDNNTLSSASCKKEQNTKHENLHMDISYTTKLKGQSSFNLPYALQRIKWQLCGVSKGRLNYLWGKEQVHDYL